MPIEMAKLMTIEKGEDSIKSVGTLLKVKPRAYLFVKIRCLLVTHISKVLKDNASAYGNF